MLEGKKQYLQKNPLLDYLYVYAFIVQIIYVYALNR